MAFLVTTPIYYVNDLPHIGHAYTSIAADILARQNRMMGRSVFFLTGTDEHGQKVQEAADSRGLSPKEHSDIMVRNFKALWQKMGLTYDAFIRTTDSEHKEIVQGLLKKLYDNGEIVKRTYSGWYCTPCERFWTEKDLRDGNCPECNRVAEQIEEENYFFLMSAYAERLIKHIEDNPTYILPETRKNEVLGFLKTHPLGDLCISRPKKRLAWGVELPFDSDYVTYVWFDALLNYYSGTIYLSPDESIKWWPAAHNIIGKDILTTHAVYWSTMLMAMGLPLPKNIFAHGWWTIDGQKMSKSIGNVVDPGEVVDKYGNDAFRYFLMREVPFGLDGDYSEHALVRRLNTELANDFGNLASRVLKMTERYFNGVVPERETQFDSSIHKYELKSMTKPEHLPFRLELALKELNFKQALEDIWELVSYTNKYVDGQAPWGLAKKEENSGKLRHVIYSCLEALRFLSIYLYPFIPDASEKLYHALGQKGSPEKLDLENNKEVLKWGFLEPGTELGELEALFPRIEPEGKKQKKQETKERKVQDEKQQDPGDNLISIGQFAKVEIKIGKVIEAERVPKSEKLIRVQVDTGEMRQIVAGIGNVYGPEDLLGKTVVIVTNLKPAKLMGVESRGMLLAATDESGRPSVIMPDRDVSPGTRIK
jgi:methionyl-tRNA synthetase